MLNILSFHLCLSQRAIVTPLNAPATLLFQQPPIFPSEPILFIPSLAVDSALLPQTRLFSTALCTRPMIISH